MSNVISFHKPAAETPRHTRISYGSKTLFLHVRSTTLIVHLAGARPETVPGGKFGSRH
jgi:hypothetical protein